jgi:hypothetical protein
MTGLRNLVTVSLITAAVLFVASAKSYGIDCADSCTAQYNTNHDGCLQYKNAQVIQNCIMLAQMLYADCLMSCGNIGPILCKSVKPGSEPMPLQMKPAKGELGDWQILASRWPILASSDHS